MKKNQLTRGEKRRVMYVENKDGLIDGASARIGWVTFSQTGRSVYYRGHTLQRIVGGGVNGNYFDTETGEEYWVSGIKKAGQNQHQHHKVAVEVDDDALAEYKAAKSIS